MTLTKQLYQVWLSHHNDAKMKYSNPRRSKRRWVIANGFDAAEKAALEGNHDYRVLSISVEGSFIVAD